MAEPISLDLNCTKAVLLSYNETDEAAIRDADS